jgi:hypothetical protein
MSDAVFSDENVIRQILRELDCSIALFACFQSETSISAATIERSLAGKRRFDPRTEAQPLARLARELRDLQRSFPCKIDWRDIPGVSGALSRRREQAAEEKSREERREREAEIEVIEPY